MVVSERQLLWHPRGDHKFVVGSGSQITLYEWDAANAEIRHASSQHDLQFMKCLAWSPDAHYDDLLAVGQATGRVDLLRLEAPRHAHRNNVLSPTGPIVSLPVLKSRSCNAVTFCHTDPNLLAVGLDKVRGEGSLMIWDINTASSSFTSALGLTTDGPSPPPHLRNHQVPRGDIGPRTDSRVLQQHAPTEAVSSVAFLRESSHLLLAGISYRWLRLFDLRTPVPSTTNVASKVHGIATDPLDANRIASFGDGVVTIWDARKLPHPVLTFTEKDASADGAIVRPQSTYQEVEFSSTRRGTLAVLERDQSYVRFWDITEAQPQAIEPATPGRPRNVSTSGRAPRKSWANLPWGGSALSDPASQSPKPELSSLALSDTRRTKKFNKPLASFALLPNSRRNPMSSNVMLVNHDGDLELYAVHDTPKVMNWSARGDFSLTARTSSRVFSGPQLPGSSKRSPSLPKAEERADQEEEAAGVGTVLPAPPVLFGRGDKEGFPALTGHTDQASVLHHVPPISQPMKMRVYSPSNMRQYSLTLEATESSGALSTKSISREPSSDVRVSRGRSRIMGHESSIGRLRHNRQQIKAVSQVVQGDMSMTMRKRALEGYGLSNPLHNSIVTGQEDSGLSDLWNWIANASDLLCHPISRINGYDFAHVGVLGIWEGFPPSQQALATSHYTPTLTTSQRSLLEVPSRTNSRRGHDRGTSRRSHSPASELDETFYAALLALATRKGANRSWKPTISTTRTVQRQVALQLCGWNLTEDELLKDVHKWENDGELSRAACWLVFTKHYSRAVELLMRSDEETHQMMSGTLAALTSGSSKNTELRDHCERLIVRLQDPYFRAMLTYLTSGEWSQILEEEEILPLPERLAIALQFLDDKALTSYLRRTAERASARGYVDALVITGLTNKGLDVLQGYVDHTGDIQTVAILGSFVHPTRLHDRRAQRWIDSYRDILDGMKLFHHRVGFDIERGQILNDAMHNGDIPTKEWIPRQIIIRCHYCNKPVTSSKGSATKVHRPTVCQNCNRSLPRCSVCLMVLRIIPDEAREAEILQSPHKDTIDDAIVTCQTCRHAGHASHILDWFFGSQSHGVCAVANCDCRCADEF